MTKIDDERTRREDLYRTLKATSGADDVSPKDIRANNRFIDVDIYYTP